VLTGYQLFNLKGIYVRCTFETGEDKHVCHLAMHVSYLLRLVSEHVPPSFDLAGTRVSSQGVCLSPLSTAQL
jgi:hypothetical protein